MGTAATIRLYEMLKPTLGESEARIFVQHFEESFEEQFASKSHELATKGDLREAIGSLRSDLRVEIAQSKADIIKWVFIFMFGQTATIVGLLKLLH